MVNSEVNSFSEADPLHRTIENTQVFLALELGRRLFDGGAHEFAEVTAQTAQTFSSREFGRSPSEWLTRIQARTGSFFVNQYLEVLALDKELARLKQVELGTFRYFSAVAQKHLNVIDAIPSSAVLASRSLEDLVSKSFFRKELAGSGRALWERVTSQYQNTLVGLIQKETLAVEDFASIENPELESHLAYVAHEMMTSIAVVAHTLDFWLTRSPSFSVNNFRMSDDRVVARTQAYLELRERCLHNHDCDRQRHLLHKARSLVISRDFLEFSKVMDEQLSSLEQLVGDLLELDAKVVCIPLRETTLHIESLAFVDAFARQLKAFGEPADEAEKLKESLFKYSLRCKVPCADVLDEEILKLSPMVRKENVTRAKLELRLNDPRYPLSVFSKDNILKIVKAAQP